MRCARRPTSGGTESDFERDREPGGTESDFERVRAPMPGGTESDFARGGTESDFARRSPDGGGIESPFARRSAVGPREASLRSLLTVVDRSPLFDIPAASFESKRRPASLGNASAPRPVAVSESERPGRLATARTYQMAPYEGALLVVRLEEKHAYKRIPANRMLQRRKAESPRHRRWRGLRGRWLRVRCR